MNALIFDIRRYTIHDGPGIRTTVFFKGCPLRCRWCHNPESQEVEIGEVSVQRVLDGKVFVTWSAVGGRQSAEDIMNEIDKDAVFYSESGGGVTFSGGEPLMQVDSLAELLVLCRKKGYHTTIDTSGHAGPDAVRKVMDLADLWLFDLKIMDDIKHYEYTGVSNESALRNLATLAEAGKEIIIRFPLIPGITDGKANLDEIADFMKKLNLERIEILPYHDIAGDKYRRLGREYLLDHMEEPGNEKNLEIKGYFVEKGFNARINK